MVSSKLKSNNYSQTNKPLVYYQCFLALAAIAIFFTKLDVYLAKRGYVAPLHPIHWISIFTVASIPIFLVIKSRINYLPAPLFTWSAFYLAISCISLLIALPSVPGIPVETTIQDFRTRILATFSLLLMAVIFATGKLSIHLWIRRAILIVTFINVFNNIYEFFYPLSFGMIEGIAGRSTGFYINANESATGLILGMIFSISLISKKYRFLYGMIVLIGIILTFSRGGLLGWLVTMIMLSKTRIITRKQISIGAIGIVLMLSFLTSEINNISYLTRDDGSSFFNQDTLTRIEWMKDPTSASEIDSNSRYRIAEDAWNKFAKSPIIGNGLSSSRDRNSVLEIDNINRFGERPHNIHLVNLVEHGFLGILVFPGLVISTIYKAKGETKNIGIVFVTYYLLAGLFSHTILYDNYSLLSLALMASMTRQSYLFSQKLANV